MKKVKNIFFKNPKKYIPIGCYCYSGNYVCPFWDKDMTKPYQNNGYCHLLGLAYWEQNRISLLWDMCKECDINEEDFDYDVDGGD